MFGNTELGWRFSAAVAGTLMVLILIRVAYRMFHSIVLAGAAGLLLALDGFHLVLSRTALLDIFLRAVHPGRASPRWCSTGTHHRRRWLRALESGFDPATRSPAAVPVRRSVPWWRLLAGGRCSAARAAVKWSAAVLRAVLRRSLVLVWRDQRPPLRRGAPAGAAPGSSADFGWLVLAGVLIVVTYLATWTGWFVTDTGYFRHCRADNGLERAADPRRAAQPGPLPLGGVQVPHRPGRPRTSTSRGRGSGCCWADRWRSTGPATAAAARRRCAAEILLLGTPLLWWSFLPALAALAWFGIARRDWRACAIGTGVAAGLLPWFWYAVPDGRTMFSFYVAAGAAVPGPGGGLRARRDHDTADGHGARAPHAPTGNWSARSWPAVYVLLVAALLRLLLSDLRGPAHPVRRLVGSHVAGQPLDLTAADA